MYTISAPIGRFGNNMYQLLEVMRQSDRDGCKIQVDKISHILETVMNVQEIVKQFNEGKNCKPKSKTETFFPMGMNRPKTRTIQPQEYFHISSKYVIPYLIGNKNKLSETTCVLHIRSGDAITNKGLICRLPPPAFYIKIIKDTMNMYKEYIIVTEPDMKNPAIHYILNYKFGDNSPSIVLSKNFQNYIEDYKLMLRCSSIITCNSSFSETSLYLNHNNLKHVYTELDEFGTMQNVLFPESVCVHTYKVSDDYYEHLPDGTHTPSKLKFMSEYVDECCVKN